MDRAAARSTRQSPSSGERSARAAGPRRFVVSALARGGDYTICEGSPVGPVVTLLPRTLDGFIAAGRIAKALSR